MTDDVMNLRSPVEKSADVELLRNMIGFGAKRLMAFEVGTQTGAGYSKKYGLRLAERNGYCYGNCGTRSGIVKLRIPKLRTGSYHPSFLRPHPMAGESLKAVIQRAHI